MWNVEIDNKLDRT